MDSEGPVELPPDRRWWWTQLTSVDLMLMGQRAGELGPAVSAGTRGHGSARSGLGLDRPVRR